MDEKNTRLYCFSPPVMLATFAIETILFIYTLVRYKMSTLTRLIASMLALLAVFQFAEYQVCGQDSGVSTASRIGYMAITLLPPIGIHIISEVTKKLRKEVVWLAYASGAGFALTFGLGKTAFTSHVCAGNYAIFQLAPNLGGIFFGYYYFWLIFGLLASLSIGISANKTTRQVLTYLIFGYLVLLIPTGIVNALNPQTIEGIPSIMCGFAILYALMLAFGISPLTLTEQKQNRYVHKFRNPR
jgi:hypothetical protein